MWFYTEGLRNQFVSIVQFCSSCIVSYTNVITHPMTTLHISHKQQALEGRWYSHSGQIGSDNLQWVTCRLPGNDWEIGKIYLQLQCSFFLPLSLPLIDLHYDVLPLPSPTQVLTRAVTNIFTIVQRNIQLPAECLQKAGNYMILELVWVPTLSGWQWRQWRWLMGSPQSHIQRVHLDLNSQQVNYTPCIGPLKNTPLKTNKQNMIPSLCWAVISSRFQWVTPCIRAQRVSSLLLCSWEMESHCFSSPLLGKPIMIRLESRVGKASVQNQKGSCGQHDKLMTRLQLLSSQLAALNISSRLAARPQNNWRVELIGHSASFSLGSAWHSP